MDNSAVNCFSLNSDTDKLVNPFITKSIVLKNSPLLYVFVQHNFLVYSKLRVEGPWTTALCINVLVDSSQTTSVD